VQVEVRKKRVLVKRDESAKPEEAAEEKEVKAPVEKKPILSDEELEKRAAEASRQAELLARQEAEMKAASWFYKAALGGGSLLDYAGYGATIGTWFQNGRKPLEVTCVMDEPAGLEVDEHSVTICRYAHGLSKIETRWGTFTDPWILQPQPKCGFVLCGTRGTISAYDYATHLRVQTAERPEGYEIAVDEVRAPFQNPIQYLLHALGGGDFERGPLHPEIARIGQQIVDSAALSAREKRTVKLVG
jgi:glucose-fructose oxidoreductase